MNIISSNVDDFDKGGKSHILMDFDTCAGYDIITLNYKAGRVNVKLYSDDMLTFWDTILPNNRPVEFTGSLPILTTPCLNMLKEVCGSLGKLGKTYEIYVDIILGGFYTMS